MLTPAGADLWRDARQQTQTTASICRNEPEEEQNVEDMYGPLGFDEKSESKGNIIRQLSSGNVVLPMFLTSFFLKLKLSTMLGTTQQSSICYRAYVSASAGMGSENLFYEPRLS